MHNLPILFFQAEDGIRVHCVTGVQTCALPIFPVERLLEGETEKLIHMEERLHERVVGQRSEERRVGKECRLGWWTFYIKKINMLPIVGTLSGKTTKLMVWPLVHLGNRNQV